MNQRRPDAAVVGGAVTKWDRYFLEMAEHAASLSKDPSTKTGAVIVRPDRTIAGTGFNGFPRGMRDDPSLYADREAKYERIIHCEMNAAISAGEDLTDCTLYTAPFLSCPRCAVHMIQWGIKRFVAPVMPPDKAERWGDKINLTRSLFLEAGRYVALVDPFTWEYVEA